MEKVNKSYYAIIPANVRYDKDLTANAKLLYGELTALSNEKGYCWATNNYFAELYSASDRSVQRWIKNLADKGYITIELIRKENSVEVLQRNIYIGNDKNVARGQNCREGDDKNGENPGDKNGVDNITSINNTSNKEKETTLDKLIGEYTSNSELIETLKDFLKMRKTIKSPVTDRGMKLLLNKLDSLATNDDDKKIYMLEESIMNNWKSVFEPKDYIKNNSGTKPISKTNLVIDDDFLKSMEGEY